jgi:nucleotide-binding universal stress UspA family protein
LRANSAHKSSHATELLVEEYAAWEGALALASDPGEQIATKEILDLATSAAVQAGVEASSEVVHGEVVQAVLNLAQERGVDLIVMGSHGRSGIARALIGSKTEGLMRRSRVPVLVAPHP